MSIFFTLNVLATQPNEARGFQTLCSLDEASIDTLRRRMTPDNFLLKRHRVSGMFYINNNIGPVPVGLGYFKITKKDLYENIQYHRPAEVNSTPSSPGPTCQTSSGSGVKSLPSSPSTGIQTVYRAPEAFSEPSMLSPAALASHVADQSTSSPVAVKTELDVKPEPSNEDPRVTQAVLKHAPPILSKVEDDMPVPTSTTDKLLLALIKEIKLLRLEVQNSNRINVDQLNLLVDELVGTKRF